MTASWFIRLPDVAPELLYDLVVPSRHSPLVQRKRARLISSRVRWVAIAFALLTPLWIVVDALVFPEPLNWQLALLRIVATLGFAAVALVSGRTERISTAMKRLAALFAIPVLFFVISEPLMSGYRFTGAHAAVAAGYAYLPFVLVAGLSVFPITALEGAIFSVVVIAATTAVVGGALELLPFNSLIGALWLLGLLATVSILAGMSQLQFMVALVKQSSHDAVTRAYTRHVGEEFLNLHFLYAQRQNAPFAVAFVDLDNFKNINDVYGHEEGDAALLRAADAMRQILRRGDVVVRWGGEEFLVIMPNTDPQGARIAIERLRAVGLGTTPAGQPQTASIGIAERMADGIERWPELVEKADKRMYFAKKGGKDRVMTVGDEMFA